MSSSTLCRAGVLALAAAVLAGCGSVDRSHGSAPTSPAGGPTGSASAAAQPDCLAGTGARAEVVTRQPLTLPAYVLGSGPDAVIASDQSDEDLCSWVPFARSLVADGFRVVLYDYRAGDVSDLGRVIRHVRADGARKVSLLGASEGAKASIVVAARTDPRVAALVSLSAETYLRQVDVRVPARHLRVPTLYVTARHDGYGAWGTGRDLDRLTPGPHRLVVVPGEQHGTALLARPAVRAQVESFLRAHGR
jgi:hypothetical protein